MCLINLLGSLHHSLFRAFLLGQPLIHQTVDCQILWLLSCAIQASSLFCYVVPTGFHLFAEGLIEHLFEEWPQLMCFFFTPRIFLVTVPYCLMNLGLVKLLKVFKPECYLGLDHQRLSRIFYTTWDGNL